MQGGFGIAFLLEKKRGKEGIAGFMRSNTSAR